MEAMIAASKEAMMINREVETVVGAVNKRNMVGAVNNRNMVEATNSRNMAVAVNNRNTAEVTNSRNMAAAANNRIVMEEGETTSSRVDMKAVVTGPTVEAMAAAETKVAVMISVVLNNMPKSMLVLQAIRTYSLVSWVCWATTSSKLLIKMLTSKVPFKLISNSSVAEATLTNKLILAPWAPLLRCRP